MPHPRTPRPIANGAAKGPAKRASLLAATLGAAALLATTPAVADGPAAPAPTLTYAFSVTAQLAPPVEQGVVDGKRRRFIGITGGTVSGPRLQGSVLPGGGDWQAIAPGGMTEIFARYSLRAADGTVIAVTNPGVRTASQDVIDRLTRGEQVDASAYYFRTTPVFEVAAGPFEWMRRHVFVARGTRNPDNVVIDFYMVE
jgi:hypothetical protein